MEAIFECSGFLPSAFFRGGKLSAGNGRRVGSARAGPGKIEPAPEEEEEEEVIPKLITRGKS